MIERRRWDDPKDIRPTERRRWDDPKDVEPPRREARRKSFTEQNVLRLKVERFQHFVWDSGTGAARGLAVLVNPTGTKTFFVNYRFPGSKRLHYKKLGRVGEMTVEEARTAALAARRAASRNRDPKADDPVHSDSFETVFETYIQQEQIGRKNNKSAAETRGVVLHNCGEFKPRAVATISYREISALLAGIRDGSNGGKPRASTAVRVFAHLRDFFGWAVREQIIAVSPMANMPSPATIKPRQRFYTNDELQAIWSAAEQLTPVESSYVKLMMLLALRRQELALAKWSEFTPQDEPSLFTVPTERVKLKASAKLEKQPKYLIPLPKLAQRLLRGLRREGELVFPDLDVTSLKIKLVRGGAPADFMLHTFRHTVATFLQNAGRSEWEVGLVLNHSGSGVTANYSHGVPIKLKGEMLTEWADHVERLVTAEGVARLR
jgi:integrase